MSIQSSEREDRVRSPTFFVENVVIVARKATEKLLAEKRRTIFRYQGGGPRITDGKQEERTISEGLMGRSGTRKSKKEEWQNGRWLIY